jgi:hypothetical protein
MTNWLETNQPSAFVCYKREFVITEFVITEFVTTEFDCIKIWLSNLVFFMLDVKMYNIETLFELESAFAF